MQTPAPEVLIRADGSEAIGIGHITRCLALADLLRDDFKIRFACQEKDPNVLALIRSEGFEVLPLMVRADLSAEIPDLRALITPETILVLDGYGFRKSYQESLRPLCRKLICIDDVHTSDYSADVVINPSEHAKSIRYDVNPGTRLLLGGDYALLRRAFLENAQFRRDFSAPIRQVMISLGGSDPSNQTMRVAQAVVQSQVSVKLNLIVGTANPNLKAIETWARDAAASIQVHSNLNAQAMCAQFMENDLLFAPGSTTAWEACCIGIPLITGITFDNQIELAKVLGEKGAGKHLGWLKDVPIEGIRSAFLDLYNDRPTRESQVVAQKSIVDGKSGERFRRVFRELKES